jgi:hypothetical protein
MAKANARAVTREVITPVIFLSDSGTKASSSPAASGIQIIYNISSIASGL